MKACPNCKETNARIYGRGTLPHVICLCGVSGPIAETDAKGIDLWDALPRQEDYEPLLDAFDRLNDWCAAYPESVFPPYSADELAMINALLKEHGYSLDCISAGVAQHMVGVVSEIVREAMKAKNPGAYENDR